MQRSQSLIPLSHDHHHGLVLCRDIREDLKRNAEPAHIVQYVLDFWHKDLKRHFEEEEKIIFPLLRKAEPNMQQALDEHRRLRAQMAVLSSDSITDLEDTLFDFAMLLETHIRFEERVLFPQIEREVPVSMLEAASCKLQQLAISAKPNVSGEVYSDVPKTEPKVARPLSAFVACGLC
jgi:iron-sulfur cluster repair protein YtfE (RIC family)